MGTVKGIAIVIGTLIAVAIVTAGIFLAGQQISRWVAPIKGETEVIEYRHSAENRIAKYNEFFSLCESVQTMEARIDVFTSDVELYSEDITSRAFTNAKTNLNAVTIGREDAVNEYNQDALRDYTGGEFRDLDLPHPLSNGYIAGGIKTLCATS